MTQLQFDSAPDPNVATPQPTSSQNAELAQLDAILKELRSRADTAKARYEAADADLQVVIRERNAARDALAAIEKKLDPLMRAKHEAHKPYAQLTQLYSEAWGKRFQLRDKLGLVKR